jgi:hypothetical protein
MRSTQICAQEQCGTTLKWGLHDHVRAAFLPTNPGSPRLPSIRAVADVLAITAETTFFAPARRTTLAASESVHPVVMTSSISPIVLPRKSTPEMS